MRLVDDEPAPALRVAQLERVRRCRFLEPEAREAQASALPLQREAARMAQIGRGKALEVVAGGVERGGGGRDVEREAERAVAQRRARLGDVDERDAEVAEDLGIEAQRGDSRAQCVARRPRLCRERAA